MIRSSLLIALVTGVSAASLEAQAPRITTAGDPSVRGDSLYRMAAKPSDYPEETALFILDDGVVRLDADGRGTRTYRQIVQVLRPEALDNYREFEFSYAPKHEKFTLNWLRVVKPDGTVISAAPTQVQESDVPAQLGDPTYSDQKVVRASVSGLEPGMIVDYSTTTEELKPFLPGDFQLFWGVSTGLRVRRSRYVVDLPATLAVRFDERNLNFARKEQVLNGRRVLTWATGNLPKLKPEAFASDSNDVYMSVTIGSPTTWATIGKWYADSARSRYTLSPAVETKLAEVVRDSRTLADSIRAVHRWVAQDIRYVSIALGFGGYRPRSPDDVVTSGYGDCKDKATLFIAAMGKFGVTAYPVILNSTGKVSRAMPSIGQLNHAIAAFKRPGAAAYEYVDLTAELTPLGELPFSYQGEFGLVVKPDGSTEEIVFPLRPATANRVERRIVGTLSTDGIFNGRYVETGTGARQYDLRSMFENPLDSTQSAKAAAAMGATIFEGATGDSLVGFIGKDLSAKPSVSLRVTGGRAATTAGANMILTNPLGSMTGLLTTVRELESAPPRLFPIDPTKIYGASETVSEVRLTLPDGWKAQLPAAVHAVSPFGEIHSTYAQNGNELLLTRTTRGVRGIRPPSDLPALIAWLKEGAKDDSRLIVIEKSR